TRPPPLFPYTTLFRSAGGEERRDGRPGDPGRERRLLAVVAATNADGAVAVHAANEVDGAAAGAGGSAAVDVGLVAVLEAVVAHRSEEHTSELQSRGHL